MSEKTWMMELDKDILLHHDRPAYLHQLTELLQGKIWAIQLILSNSDLKRELVSDSRTQQLLQVVTDHE